LTVAFLTADLVDEYSDVLRCCHTQFRDFGGRTRFHGPVRTLKLFEDNALLKQTLLEPGAGAVLVVDGLGSLRCSLLGDFLAGLGAQNGWAGMVVWGAVRDTVALRGLDFGLKAIGSNPWRSRKTGAGMRDVPVRFGGVEFRPGDWLYADEDGVVVSDRELHAPTKQDERTAHAM
jgi:regulator of ribonuclease activity A